jgi:DNA-binding NtrC family response regulator
MAKTILIVDDEATQLRILESVVAHMGFHVRTAKDGEEALHILAASAEGSIDVMILDLEMPRMGGIEVLKLARPKFPALPILVLTAHSSLKNVVEAMKVGANDFISKPASAERIRTAIAAAIDHLGMVGELTPVKKTFVAGDVGFDQLIGDSPVTLEVIKLARKAAGSNIPVLIEGESGVGKELFARSIHAASSRRDGPMIIVNCGAIPENLVESILFGHEKGAFTGAGEKHAGKFIEASGGTLFLDEIGELPQDIQVKLLRAVQEKEVDPVGASQPVKVDIRLISATNRNLAAMVSSGDFREDLFYRLNVFPLNVPPLRQRREDIPGLASHFIRAITKEEGLKDKSLSPAATLLLNRYEWPGNIRQLQNAIFRAVVMCDGKILDKSDFPQIAGAGVSCGQGLSAAQYLGGPTAAQSNVSLKDQLHMTAASGDIKTMSDLERSIIHYALQKYEGRMSEISRQLGIGRSTLYRKIAQYGLEKKTD